MEKNRKKHVLTVYTGDRAAQIFVLDSQFHLCARSSGDEASFQLNEGSYIVQVKSGSETREEAFALERECSVHFKPIDFKSPVPLPGVSQASGSKLEMSLMFSWGSIPVDLGTGSKLYVFGNSPSSNYLLDAISSDIYPARGLTLRDFDDRVLINFSDYAVGSPERIDNCWLACALDVKPGNYVLCLETDDGNSYRQTVVTCDNWQTQVFLELRDYGVSKRDIAADLFNSSIMMSKTDYGFNPRDEVNFSDGTNYRVTEQVRQFLGRKKDTISRELMQTLTSDEFDNPMLGLYSAHLLIRNSDGEFAVVKTIIKSLRRMLGTAHPDVEALALKVGLSTDFVFNEFPMFADSWKFVLERSFKNPALVPANAISYRLSGQFWSNECWLIWGKSGQSDRLGLQVELATIFRGKIDSSVSKVLTKAVSQVARAVTSNRNVVSKVEKYLPSFKSALGGQMASLASDSVVQLTQNLGVPHGRISELISEISALDLTSAVKILVEQELPAKDDPQKEPWGSKATYNSRTIRASARKTKVDGVYDVSVSVSSTKKDNPLLGEVQFHLHDTFLNPSPVIPVIDGRAVLKLSNVWGSFTVGAIADDGGTRLEFDLSKLRNVSDEFRSR